MDLIVIRLLVALVELNIVKLILIIMSANVLFVMRQYVMITPVAMIRFAVFAIRTIVKIILLLNVVPILRIVIRRPVKFVKQKYAVCILLLIQWENALFVMIPIVLITHWKVSITFFANVVSVIVRGIISVKSVLICLFAIRLPVVLVGKSIVLRMIRIIR